MNSWNLRRGVSLVILTEGLVGKVLFDFSSGIIGSLELAELNYCTSWTQLLSGKSSYWIPHQLIVPKELTVSLQVFVKNCHMIRFETDL